MIGENYMKQIILSLKHWVNNNFALKESIPEVPVTSVNNMTGDVIIEIPEGFSGSWNDLEDKPFYSDETIFAHVENVEEYVHTEDGSFYFSAYFGCTELPENVSSLIGANISATINGTQIDGVLKEVTYYSDYWLSDATTVAMGNLHLLNNKSDSLVDTGEDWCISVDVGEHYPYDHAVVFTVYGRERCDIIVESLTCFTGSGTKTLDEKFISSNIARISQLPIDKVFEVKYEVHDIYDVTEAYEDNKLCYVIYNGETYFLTSYNWESQTFTSPSGHKLFLSNDYGWESDENSYYNYMRLNYYTKSEIDTYELITTADIDAICGASIVAASEVTF